MWAVDLPEQLQERVVCSVAASVQYQVPANILLAIAEIENGKPGQRVRNVNGTEDVGVMQFNTAYLASLSQYGITADVVSQKGCYPYQLAAWRLRQHIENDTGDLWTRVSNYHSRTPAINARYRAKVMQKATKWASWLTARFKTHEVRFDQSMGRRST